MYQLYSQGDIDHNVFSIFMDIDSDGGPKTHLKIGGYDQDTLMDGESLQFVNT